MDQGFGAAIIGWRVESFRYVWALRIILSVGHLRESFLMEVDALHLVWMVRAGCVGFWFRVLSGPLNEEMILRELHLKLCSAEGHGL